MTSREKILEEVKRNQPSAVPLPELGFQGPKQNNVQEYIDTFTSVGGKAVTVDNLDSIKALIMEQFEANTRMITTLPEFAGALEMYSAEADPRSFENVEMALIRGHFAVAENGAVWFTEEIMGQRIIPFICKHLAVVVEAAAIVPTMHEAYERIGAGNYGFGVFIAGPSKTADIEQALVLGAHGPLSMTVFIVK